MGGSEERTADVGCGPQVFPVVTGQRFSDRISLVGHGLIVVANFSLRSGGGGVGGIVLLWGSHSWRVWRCAI